jgi:hypothetical protein
MGENMKQAYSILFGSMLVLISNSSAMALIYDFTSMDALIALDGQTESTFNTSGLPVDVQAGLTNSFGDFILGEEGATLAVFNYSNEGLGVVSTTSNSQVNSDTGIPGKFGSVVFGFDPLFIPEEIALNKFFVGEDIRIFTNGVLFGDFSGNSTGTITLALGGVSISTLQVTSLGIDSPLSSSDDSDFYVASIKGNIVPEPSTIILFFIGILGLVGFRLVQATS